MQMSALLSKLALFVIVILSNMLGLTSLNWLLLAVLQNGALVLVILFQPELRKMLERSLLDWTATRFCVWAGFALPEDFDNWIRWRWPEMMARSLTESSRALELAVASPQPTTAPATASKSLARRVSCRQRQSWRFRG